ncbi:MAG: FKBP-type peptidyl-prolyl cis-trans isomerase [Chlamydiales bacterium]|jgi:FKBP-type peptidyl-prolyl cis-trans isomerase
MDQRRPRRVSAPLALPVSGGHNLGMHHLINVGLSIALTGLVSCQGGASDGADAGATEATEAGEATEASEASPPAETAAPSEAEGAMGGEVAKAEGDWSDGDTIPSGKEGVPELQILTVHKNGSGEPCGSGKRATVAYTAMLADGTVIDPGNKPYAFVVGAGSVIKGWDVVVARMRVGDSFTITIPQDLAYGASKGDLKFDMELLSFE